MAGAGTYAGPALGALNYQVAPVMPYRAFGDTPDQVRGIFHRIDAISFMSVPSTPSQTQLAEALPPGALELQIELPPNCPVATAHRLCGFGADARVLLVDHRGAWDIYTVEQIDSGAMHLQHRRPSSITSYEAGSIASEIRAGSYFLKSDLSAGTFQLMRHDGWSTELPVVDEVVSLEFRYFGSAPPPQLTGATLDAGPGPWTTYGPAPPPLTISRGSWPPGENCTFAVIDGTHVPRLAVLAADSTALVELTPAILTDGPWCPDALSLNRFDADLLRVRRVAVSLRVQSAVASLRGPAGTLFMRGGTARASDRFLPDLLVRFDVTPRNLNLTR